MKKNFHPIYRAVVFKDMTNDTEFLVRSTVATKETTTFEGKEYPLHKIDISSASHPFFTGKNILMDTDGRVEKYNKKFGKKTIAKDAEPAA